MFYIGEFRLVEMMLCGMVSVLVLDKSLSEAWALLENIHTYNYPKVKGAIVTQMRTETKWQPPDESLIKINMNGTISSQNHVPRMKVVARNH